MGDMRKRVILVLCAVLFCALPASADAPAAFASAIDWTYSYDEALRSAAKTNKPIMAFFYTTWCTWCKKLDEVTFADDAVSGVSRAFVCLRIDAEKDRPTAYRYGLGAFPAILFLDQSGRVIWREYGFREPAMMAGRMEGVLSAFRRNAALQPYLQKAAEALVAGDIDKAIAVIGDAIAVNTDDARLYVARGSLKMRRGAVKSALDDFDLAVALNSSLAAAYVNRAYAYLALKEYEKSWDDVRQLELRGQRIPPDLLEKLRGASGGDK